MGYQQMTPLFLLSVTETNMQKTFTWVCNVDIYLIFILYRSLRRSFTDR